MFEPLVPDLFAKALQAIKKFEQVESHIRMLHIAMIILSCRRIRLVRKRRLMNATGVTLDGCHILMIHFEVLSEME
jgi:hypothetical protein